MPQARLSTVLAAASSSTFAAKATFAAAGTTALAPSASKAFVRGVISDLNNTYYCDLNGFVIRASATIDAAIQIGDGVLVQQTKNGYVITGTF